MFTVILKITTHKQLKTCKNYFENAQSFEVKLVNKKLVNRW